jgi:ketosteroid isomerase-like protein
MTANVGERFAAALLAKDWEGVTAVLDPAVDFRGLTPGQQWEAKTPDDLVNQVFSRWFEPSDDIYDVLDVSTGQVVDRQRVVYRFRVRNPGGDYVCEQTAYYDTRAGRITKLRILCTRFLPSGGRGLIHGWRRAN